MTKSLGDMTPLELAREACARRAEADGATHTAAGYRMGRYDEGGVLPWTLYGVEIAMEVMEAVMVRMAEETVARMFGGQPGEPTQ